MKMDVMWCFHKHVKERNTSPTESQGRRTEAMLKSKNKRKSQQPITAGTVKQIEN
jgi:hypothetical protein